MCVYAHISCRLPFLHRVGERYERGDGDLPSQTVIEVPLSFLQAALKMNLKYFHISSGTKRAEKYKLTFREHTENQRLERTRCVGRAVGSWH